MNKFTLSAALNGDRATHDFTVTEPSGASWSWTPAGDWTDPTPTIDLIDPWTSRPWTLRFPVLDTSSVTNFSGTCGQWTLTDNATGDTLSFDPGTTHAYRLDATQ